MDSLLRKLGIELPIIQAPMAGVSTPEIASAVSNAGGLGSIGVGSVDSVTTRQMITAVRSMTVRPFNVNVFCNQPAVADVVEMRRGSPGSDRSSHATGATAGSSDRNLRVVSD